MALARVTEIHSGSDGKVRVVTVSTGFMHYTRPYSKSALLYESSLTPAGEYVSASLKLGPLSEGRVSPRVECPPEQLTLGCIVPPPGRLSPHPFPNTWFTTLWLPVVRSMKPYTNSLGLDNTQRASVRTIKESLGARVRRRELYSKRVTQSFIQMSREQKNYSISDKKK